MSHVFNILWFCIVPKNYSGENAMGTQNHVMDALLRRER
jgi:thermostable 8-oxoguanine DNA glycosylase